MEFYGKWRDLKNPHLWEIESYNKKEGTEGGVVVRSHVFWEWIFISHSEANLVHFS